MDKEFEWKIGISCVFNNFIHLIFVTKYRRDVFTKPMLTHLRELFDETCTQVDVELVEFGGEDDHVHLMVCRPPKLAISNLVGKPRGKSSCFLRQEYWSQIRDKLWGPSVVIKLLSCFLWWSVTRNS